MINFEDIKISGNDPLYMQLISFIKNGLANGTIISGDELPSRRVVSALLGINPNTVQKAYAVLESEGLIHSRSGAKSYICVSPETVKKIRADLVGESGRKAVEMLKGAGFTKEEAIETIEKYWVTED